MHFFLAHLYWEGRQKNVIKKGNDILKASCKKTHLFTLQKIRPVFTFNPTITRKVTIKLFESIINVFREAPNKALIQAFKIREGEVFIYALFYSTFRKKRLKRPASWNLQEQSGSSIFWEHLVTVWFSFGRTRHPFGIELKPRHRMSTELTISGWRINSFIIIRVLGTRTFEHILINFLTEDEKGCVILLYAISYASCTSHRVFIIVVLNSLVVTSLLHDCYLTLRHHYKVYYMRLPNILAVWNLMKYLKIRFPFCHLTDLSRNNYTVAGIQYYSLDSRIYTVSMHQNNVNELFFFFLADMQSVHRLFNFIIP